MNIVVCVKYVPDAQSDRGFNEDNTTDREGVDGLLSELDEYAVEQALQIVEAGEGEVTVLTIGPADAAEAVKKSLQMGADKGVHICDDAIAGSDALATSLVLAEAIKKIGTPDIVLTGMASTDGTMGVVPAMLAERLGLPRVTYASELSVDGGVATMRRDGDTASETVQPPPGADLGHRPDQRAALPLLQGDHGRQEEAGRGVDPRRPRCRRRSGRPRQRGDRRRVDHQASSARAGHHRHR